MTDFRIQGKPIAVISPATWREATRSDADMKLFIDWAEMGEERISVETAEIRAKAQKYDWDADEKLIWVKPKDGKTPSTLRTQLTARNPANGGAPQPVVRSPRGRKNDRKPQEQILLAQNGKSNKEDSQGMRYLHADESNRVWPSHGLQR